AARLSASPHRAGERGQLGNLRTACDDNGRCADHPDECELAPRRTKFLPWHVANAQRTDLLRTTSEDLRNKAGGVTVAFFQFGVLVGGSDDPEMEGDYAVRVGPTDAHTRCAPLRRKPDRCEYV